MNGSQTVNIYNEMKEYAQPQTDYRATEPRQIVRGLREQCSIDELRGTPNFEPLLKLAEKLPATAKKNRSQRSLAHRTYP